MLTPDEITAAMTAKRLERLYPTKLSLREHYGLMTSDPDVGEGSDGYCDDDIATLRIATLQAALREAKMSLEGVIALCRDYEDFGATIPDEFDEGQGVMVDDAEISLALLAGVPHE